MERIGFIGLGNMGHPMAKNIEKAGFPLSVYNRSLEKAKDFEEKSTFTKHDFKKKSLDEASIWVYDE